MLKIASSVVIHRSIAEVFAYAANFANDPRWQRRVLEARATSEPPLGEGSSFWFSTKLLGRTSAYDAVVNEFEENRSCAYSGGSAAAPVVDYRSFAHTREGARFTIAIDLGGGFPGILASLVKQRAQRQLDADVLALKERLEARAAGGRV